jgi:hypothetical protein
MSRVLAALAVSAALVCAGCGVTGVGKNVPELNAGVPNHPQLLSDQSAAPGWPGEPGGTAWLDQGFYHLLARDPGNFVAVRAPLVDPPPNLQVSAASVSCAAHLAEGTA